MIDVQEGLFMAAITRENNYREVLACDINTSKFFLDMGMHCLGCPSSQGESIEEASWCMAQMQMSLLHSSTNSSESKQQKAGTLSGGF